MSRSTHPPTHPPTLLLLLHVCDTRRQSQCQVYTAHRVGRLLDAPLTARCIKPLLGDFKLVKALHELAQTVSEPSQDSQLGVQGREGVEADGEELKRRNRRVDRGSCHSAALQPVAVCSNHKVDNHKAGQHCSGRLGRTEERQQGFPAELAVLLLVNARKRRIGASSLVLSHKVDGCEHGGVHDLLAAARTSWPS